MKVGKNKLLQKILMVTLTTLILFNFIMPTVVRADEYEEYDDEEVSSIAGPIQSLITLIGDAGMSLIQYVFVGNWDATIKQLNNVDWWGGEDKIYIPNFEISPEYIFRGKIPAFDINFFNPMESTETTNSLDEYGFLEKFTVSSYMSNGNLSEENVKKAIEERLEYLEGESITISQDEKIKVDQGSSSTIYCNFTNGSSYKVYITIGIVEDGSIGATVNLYKKGATEPIVRESSAKILQSTVSYWYNQLRNIAIIGLLSVLVYVGIRIVLSSAASDKSKYKEMLKDWAVAMCLLFFMHYFMNFTVTITQSISEALGTTTIEENQAEEQYEVDGVTFTGDRLIGETRIKLQTEEKIAARWSYTIIYLVIVIYTVIFAVMYLKRVIYMAFFTMIAPLVALTYPLDKARDGKAQAFDMWMKEYTFNALIQPFHLIIYYVLVSSAMDLAVSNPLYALVAIGFMMPAEKLLRKFFGFNKSETSGVLGGALGGAMIMQGINALQKRAGSSGGKKAGGEEGKENSKQPKVVGNKIAGLIEEEAINGNTDTSKNALDPEDALRIANGLDPLENNQNTTDDSSKKNNNRTIDVDNIDDDYNRNMDIPDFDEDLEAENALRMANGLDPIETDIPNDYDERKNYKEEMEELEDEDFQANNALRMANGLKPLKSKQQQEEEKLKKEERNRLAKAKTLTGARWVGKGLLAGGKLVARGTAAATLGTIGVAAGLASDDYSNVLKFGAAGAVAGNAVANAGINRVKRLPSDAYRIKQSINEERERFEQDAYTREQRKQMAISRQQQEFEKDKKNQRLFQDAFKGQWQERMRDASKYVEYGINDPETIIKAMNLKTPGLGDYNDNKRIIIASRAPQLGRKEVDDEGTRLRARGFGDKAEVMKKGIREFNDWS
ncbi:MAG: hypothetical protein J6A29_03945 [Clostridia bacterium]|nr:hypothetical protein [Clostridia bacterium]